MIKGVTKEKKRLKLNRFFFPLKFSITRLPNMGISYSSIKEGNHVEKAKEFRSRRNTPFFFHKVDAQMERFQARVNSYFSVYRVFV